MIKEYKYRPPIKYLLIGLSGIAAAIIFGIAIFAIDAIWLSIIAGIFCILTLAGGGSMLAIFIRKFNVGNLKIGKDFIEIPGRWEGRIRLGFKEILNIGETNNRDNIIQVESKHGIHMIEQNWMENNDFESVKKALQKYCIKK